MSIASPVRRTLYEIFRQGEIMNNIRKCPNCIQSASEAYQQGYADAMKLYQDEILKASQLRPIQFVVPKDCVQQQLSDSEAEASTFKSPKGDF